MQITGLVSTAVSTDLPRGYDDDPVYFTYEPTANLSSEENIIVLILDSLDVVVLRYIFELYPHLQDYLYGFTLYENNTAEHFGTTQSIVSMITQHHVREGISGWHYMEEAWAFPNFLDILKENGYTINLYLDQIHVFEHHEQLRDRADNFAVTDTIYANNHHVIPMSARLALGRVSPYLLKNVWISSVPISFGRSFYYISVHDNIASYMPIVDIYSDMRFYDFLRLSEFSIDNEKKNFILIHFSSVHSDGDINDPWSTGYHFDEESGEIRQGGSRWDIGRASFEKLNLYFSKLKEIGAYDNSTIIIMGDHGRRYELPETTAIFIKPKGSTGPLVTDTTTELSHKYFPASILDIAGIPHHDFGISYFDIIKGLIPEPPARILYVVGAYTPHMARTHGDSGVWKVIGDANNIDNWTFIPAE